MAINVNINIDVDDTGGSISALINGTNSGTKRNLQGIANFISALQGGQRNLSSGRITITTKSTALLTLTGLPSAGETFVINGKTFTARASGATGDEYNIGASATATASAIAAAINASTSTGIKDAVVASSSAGVVTITAIVDGYSALGFTISESMANTTATAWTTTTKTANITI